MSLFINYFDISKINIFNLITILKLIIKTKNIPITSIVIILYFIVLSKILFFLLSKIYLTFIFLI